MSLYIYLYTVFAICSSIFYINSFDDNFNDLQMSLYVISGLGLTYILFSLDTLLRYEAYDVYDEL